MTEAKNITITIINKSRISRAFLTGANITMSFVLPVALGVILDSVAMQWVGFLFGILVMIGTVRHIQKDLTFSTVEQAKAYLDRLRADGEAA